MDTNGSALTPRSVDESVRPSMAPAAIKIDKDVPIPPSPGRKGNPYPLAQMEVGDSFAAPYSDPTSRWKICKTAHAHGHYYKRKYTTQSLVENGVKVVRVWRVA